MKALLLIAALLLPVASHAASLEEDYVTARNKHVAALAAATQRKLPHKEIAAQQARALADLERQLRRIIGPVALKGVAGQGKINLEGLTEGDLDYGLLDGLLYVAADSRTRILVSTQNLLKVWLRDNSNFRDIGGQMPQGMVPALRWAPFYTRALGGGAAFGGFAEIPVGTDTGYATAQLVARAQDIGPRNPGELVVAVIRGHRVFIVSVDADAPLMPVPDCDALWPELKKQIDAGYAAYRLSGMTDKSVLEANRKAEDATEIAYRGCFAERAPRDPNYKKLSAQAQAIVDGLPAK